MAITRALGVAVALAGGAIGLASPAWADGLDGDYTFTNGATTNTWTITTQCNPEGVCAGTVSGSTGLLAQIRKPADGPWTVERHDVPDAWSCLDVGTGPADQLYSFDPATLVGTLTVTPESGVCNEPFPGHAEYPISLVKV